jgi:hypothetical protein
MPRIMPRRPKKATVWVQILSIVKAVAAARLLMVWAMCPWVETHGYIMPPLRGWDSGAGGMPR